jgi:hypothetical protein
MQIFYTTLLIHQRCDRALQLVLLPLIVVLSTTAAAALAHNNLTEYNTQ